MLVTLALPLAAQAADVYRCVEKGVTTYQDFPCRAPDSGKVVRLAPEPTPPRASSQDDLEALRKSVDTMARERRQRQIAEEIDGLERTLTRLGNEETAELNDLRARRKYMDANYLGDPFNRTDLERYFDKEIAAVSAKYRERTETARRRIVDLRNEQKTLTTARQ